MYGYIRVDYSELSDDLDNIFEDNDPNIQSMRTVELELSEESDRRGVRRLQSPQVHCLGCDEVSLGKSKATKIPVDIKLNGKHWSNDKNALT